MRVVYTPRAQQDLRDIASFYILTPRTAQRFIERVRHTCLGLEIFPELGRVSNEDPSLRRLVVPKTPYTVIYKLSDGQQVEIVHVADMRRSVP